MSSKVGQPWVMQDDARVIARAMGHDDVGNVVEDSHENCE